MRGHPSAVHRQADRPKGALLMILDTESWMNIRRFRALHAAGATFVEIGRECGCDWRTVRKYLAEDAASVPPTGPPRTGTQLLLITPSSRWWRRGCGPI